ncbi:MAG: molybdopterin synthase catalytic subunit [Candidatus Bathyarchaeia archaeon]|jgi:molybdopterin synthase catalytic subunit|nr:molybdenum cofactor biosynthesis protein MoaE [Candidatus Bathyarchaeota archaeon A05DMB-4]MDH7594876.1 molybdenum cofactor biosynthesis protein MoaE [Candidatus Bathyarchaeota archaeon]
MVKHAGVHAKDTFSLFDLMESVKAVPDFNKVGAVALFIGVARGETKDKQPVERLELEAYEEKADEVLEKICKELKEKTGIVDVQIHHLLGEFKIGEEMVYVAVAGGHRTDVFPVLREAVERYKREVPIFKKEHVTDKKGKVSAYWVSEK